jgi:Dolichyl-phosphate-mannose-protein mannosyltransferase
MELKSKPISGNVELLLFSFILLINIFLLNQGINEYFLKGHQGFNGSLRATIARNYIRYGYADNKGMPLKNIGPVKNGTKKLIHWHHPPLMNIFVGISFSLFGESEWATRLVPILASLIIFILLFYLVRELYGSWCALLSCLFLTLSPMNIEYGKMANYETIVVMFSLIALFFYYKIKYKNGNWKYSVGLLISILCAAFTDWPGFIFAAILGFDAVLRPKRKIKLFLLIGFLSSILLVICWYWLNSYGDKSGLTGLAKWRVGQDAGAITYSTLKIRIWARLKDYFGILPLLTGFIWFLVEVIWKKRVNLIVTFFLFTTIIYFLIFKKAAFIHLFFLYYFLPAFAVAAGIGVVKGFLFLNTILKIVRNYLIKWEKRKFKSSKFKISFRKLTPFRLSIFFLILWGSFYFKTSYKIINKAKLISSGIRGGALNSKTPLPYAGRLDLVLLAKIVKSISKPDDKILMHFNSNFSPQFKYYMDRNFKKIRRLGNLKDGAVLIVPQRKVNHREQIRLATKYPVIKTLRYFIYDLKRKGIKIREFDFKTYPSTWWWSYSNSILYPPHRLIYNRKKSLEYKLKLGL